MTRLTTSLAHGRRGRWGARLGVLGTVVALVACNSLLDVENPNNIGVDDLDNPKAAPYLANGALSAVARAWGAVLTSYATASDELTWSGSRDGFRELDVGDFSNPTNEFNDAWFPFVGEARWLSDFTIQKLSAFDAAGTLANRNDLARTYLYGAIAYIMIGDMFNNFPIGSDRTVAAAPLGRANMDSVYEVAIAYATAGLAVTTDATLRRNLYAISARAWHAKAVWALIHPVGSGVPTGGNPLVNDPLALADAIQALTLGAAVADWKLRFSYSTTTVQNTIGAWVIGRQEMRIGERYVRRTPTADTLRDLISGLVDPEMRRAVVEFTATAATQDLFPLTVTSAREMHLIRAEAALAANDSITAATHINTVRALNSLTPYDPTNAAHPRARDMLRHTRKVNLWMQGRRLQDLYRFRELSDIWRTTLPLAEAVAQPGILFPITQQELLSNPFCVASPAACQ